MTETLNYKQLAKKFPVCPNTESASEAWSKMLARWRDEGKLEQRKHWRYGPSVDGSNRPSRYYDLAKIVRLVCVEARGDRPRPRISFLYTEFYDTFLEILSTANAAKAVGGQANTPEVVNNSSIKS